MEQVEGADVGTTRSHTVCGAQGCGCLGSQINSEKGIDTTGSMVDPGGVVSGAGVGSPELAIKLADELPYDLIMRSIGKFNKVDFAPIINHTPFDPSIISPFHHVLKVDIILAPPQRFHVLFGRWTLISQILSAEFLEEGLGLGLSQNDLGWTLGGGGVGV